MTDFVLPGNRLGHANDLVAGDGTYVLGNAIYSSTLGVKKIEPAVGDQKLPKVYVVREKEVSSVPDVESTVVCKVTRVNPMMAHVDILVVNNSPCQGAFKGIIRVQDVRETEKDKVQIYRSFRPGDIVRAQVISLGDARSYYLSTAKNELGVIFAQSLAGYTMVPLSWQEMVCPKTKAKEFRKCAKLF